MRATTNRQVILKSRPTGIPEAENFEIIEGPLPALADGQVLVRNIFLTAEPAMRGWVSTVGNYSQPVPLGGVMRSPAVGRVEQSRHPDFQSAEFVTGMFGWQGYAAVDAAEIQRKVPATGLPISTALGVLGLNGLTAYFALLDVGQPSRGETVVVSTAARARRLLRNHLSLGALLISMPTHIRSPPRNTLEQLHQSHRQDDKLSWRLSESGGH